jgi:hypothetical protein
MNNIQKYLFLLIGIAIIFLITLFGDSNIINILYTLQSYFGIYLYMDENFMNIIENEEGFQDDMTKYINDCKAYGYNSAKRIDGKTYCTLNLPGIPIAHTQKCVLSKTQNVGDELKENEYYCSSNDVNNERKRRNALLSYYNDNPEYYEITNNATLDIGKSTPLVQFNKVLLNNGKLQTCYKPIPMDIENAEEIEDIILNKYSNQKIKPCSICPTGFETHNIKSTTMNICKRSNKYKSKVYIKPSKKFNRLSPKYNNNKIPLRILYNNKNLDFNPSNGLFKNIVLGQYIPWGWDKKITIERRHGTMSEYLNIRQDLDTSDYIFYNIKINGDENNYIVFYPISELKTGTGSFTTLDWRIEENDSEYFNIENRIAMALTDQLNIGGNIRNYIRSLAENSKFMGDLKKYGRYPIRRKVVYYETKRRMFRRNKKIKKYRTVEKLLTYSQLEKAYPKLFEKLMKISKMNIINSWKNINKNKIINRYINSGESHDNKLREIYNNMLKRVIRLNIKKTMNVKNNNKHRSILKSLRLIK